MPRPSNGENAAAIPHFLLEIVLRRSAPNSSTPAQLNNPTLKFAFNIGTRSKSPEPRHPTSRPTYMRAERQVIKRRGARKTGSPSRNLRPYFYLPMSGRPKPPIAVKPSGDGPLAPQLWIWQLRVIS
jgi:hypothetical protein